jgi:hypothetical protein
VLDAGESRLEERSPKTFARCSIYNGAYADAHGVEIRVERKADGTAAVAVNVYDPQKGDWSRLFSTTLAAHLHAQGAD